MERFDMPATGSEATRASPTARRRRPHPARRARRLTGAAGVVGTLAMTTYMAIHAALASPMAANEVSSTAAN